MGPAIVLSVLLGAATQTATITGTLTWAEPTLYEALPASVDEGVCDKASPLRRWNVQTDGQGRVQGAVVRLADPAGSSVSASQVDVIIEGCQFSPRVIVLGVGSEIRFRSVDPILHNVTLYGPDGTQVRSTTLVTARQETAYWRMDKPGHYRVASLAGHHWMNAHVWVVERGPVATTGVHGGFSLPGVPAGTRRIVAWHPDLGLSEVDVEVGVGEVQADLRF